MPARLPPPSLFVGFEVDRRLERYLGSRDGARASILGQDLPMRLQVRGDHHIGRPVPDGIDPTGSENLADDIRSILTRAGANV